MIRSLALDEGVYRLEQALSEAGISRSARPYTTATRKVELLGQKTAQLESEVNRLRSSINNIESIGPEYVRLRATLETVAARLAIAIDNASEEDIRATIQKVDAALQETLTSAMVEQLTAEGLAREHALLSRRGRQIESVERIIDDLGNSRKKKEERLALCEKRIANLREQLADTQFAPESIERRLALARALEQVQSIPDLEVCPICDQQFHNLNLHIEEKLSGLRAQQSSIEKSIGKLRSEVDSEVTEMQSMTLDISSLDLQIQHLRSESAFFGRDFLHFVERVMPASSGQISPDQLNDFIQDRARKSAQEAEELSKLALDLRQVISSFESSRMQTVSLRKQLSVAEKELSDSNLRLKRARLAQERLDAFVDITQEGRRRLSNGIDEVLRDFVMGRTKDAFEDLFRRLAKNPFFQVTVSDVRVKRHKPEVDWCAVYDKREFPGEGVFSQGELNSCAIAFFLALATAHPGSLKLLMLDDPVQNMDEMHIEEFGNILKALKDDLGWQIVVGLHDQSVYQYLMRQLYPCSEGQSLISYGFEEGKDGTRLRKAELVEFNRAALIAEVA